MKFPLARSEARGISTEVENTNRASGHHWRGYATPWAASGDLGGLGFGSFPRIDDDVVSAAAAEDALATVLREVTGRADSKLRLADTDVMHRIDASAANGLLQGAELSWAIRALHDAGQHRTRVVLSHGDLHRGNLMIAKRQFRVIDWQSAETNPAFLDPLHSANIFHNQGSARFAPLVAWSAGASVGPLGRIAEEHLDGTTRVTATLLAILHACSQFGADGAIPPDIARDADAAIRSIIDAAAYGESERTKTP